MPCYLALFILAEYVPRPLLPCHGLTPDRIFELLMAFDALRLRNVIQLLGILGEPSSRHSSHGIAKLTRPPIAFHLALVVFAAIQVHETRAAVVRPGNDNPMVSTYAHVYLGFALMLWLVAHLGSWVAVAQSPALPDCLAHRHLCVMVWIDVLDTRALLRVRVRYPFLGYPFRSLTCASVGQSSTSWAQIPP